MSSNLVSLKIISTPDYHCYLEGKTHQVAIPWKANIKKRLKPIYSGHPQEPICKGLLMQRKDIVALKDEQGASDIWSRLKRWVTGGKYVYIPEKCQCKRRPTIRHPLPPKKQVLQVKQVPQIKQTPAVVVVPPLIKEKMASEVIHQCTYDKDLGKRSADNARAKQCIEKCKGKSGADLGNCTALFW